MIEPIIHHIDDTMTAEADQMVMRSEIGIKPCPVVTYIYFLDEPGLLQRAQGVIHRIQREHGVSRRDFSIQLFCGGMGGALAEDLIDGCPLGSTLEPSRPKFLLNVSYSYVHVIPV